MKTYNEFVEKKEFETKREAVLAYLEYAKENNFTPYFYQADLSRADLRCVNLTGVNLTGVNLRYADLRCADLVGVNLRCAVLFNANLSWANLTKAALRYADLTGADLTQANLTNADLSYANLRWAILRYVDLTMTDLRCADLTKADLTQADLRCVNLTQGDIKMKNEKLVQNVRSFIEDGIELFNLYNFGGCVDIEQHVEYRTEIYEEDGMEHVIKPAWLQSMIEVLEDTMACPDTKTIYLLIENGNKKRRIELYNIEDVQPLTDLDDALNVYDEIGKYIVDELYVDYNTKISLVFTPLNKINYYDTIKFKWNT